MVVTRQIPVADLLQLRTSEGAGPRMSFQRNCMQLLVEPGERVLNVGCADNPVLISGNVTQFDYDDWTAYYNQTEHTFVQGDAHYLTRHFPKDSFGLVIAGDMLEHVEHPLRVVHQAYEVSRKWVLLTIWEEWRLQHDGFNAESLGAIEREAVEKGFGNVAEFYESEHPGCRYVDGVSHLPHIWQFTDQHMASLYWFLIGLGAIVHMFYKVSEVMHEGHEAYNWLVLVEKGDLNENWPRLA